MSADASLDHVSEHPQYLRPHWQCAAGDLPASESRSVTGRLGGGPEDSETVTVALAINVVAARETVTRDRPVRPGP